MSRHLTGVEVQSSGLKTESLDVERNRVVAGSYAIYRDHDEGPAACHLRDYGQEFGVDGAELGVVRVLRYGDVVVAFLPFGWFAVDVAKFRAPHTAEPQLK